MLVSEFPTTSPIVNPACCAVDSTQRAEIEKASAAIQECMRCHVTGQSRITDNLIPIVEPACNAGLAAQGSDLFDDTRVEHGNQMPGHYRSRRDIAFCIDRQRLAIGSTEQCSHILHNGSARSAVGDKCMESCVAGCGRPANHLSTIVDAQRHAR